MSGLSRREQIVAVAREILEADGPEALTMRHLADRIGIRAPSLYKHFENKQALEAALIEDALREMGACLHSAIDGVKEAKRVVLLLEEYRRVSLATPQLYGLATGPGLNRSLLTPGLEDWAGEPFFLVTGDPHLAQALWAFAHGMAILEIERRFVENSDLDRTWATGAKAFTKAVAA